MKKIVFLAILLLTTGIIFSCNTSDAGDSEKGYVDPGLDTAKTVSPDKEYTFSGSISDSCGPSVNCNSIIFSGTLSDKKYVGIAADNRDTVVPPTFKFKIYWQISSSSSIPEGTNLTLSSCTIILNDQTATGVDVTNVNITNEGDDTYTVVFNDTIPVGTSSIVSGNSIRGYKY